jgi:hypothetical protein
MGAFFSVSNWDQEKPVLETPASVETEKTQVDKTEAQDEHVEQKQDEIDEKEDQTNTIELEEGSSVEMGLPMNNIKEEMDERGSDVMEQVDEAKNVTNIANDGTESVVSISRKNETLNKTVVPVSATTTSKDAGDVDAPPIAPIDSKLVIDKPASTAMQGGGKRRRTRRRTRRRGGRTPKQTAHKSAVSSRRRRRVNAINMTEPLL